MWLGILGCLALVGAVALSGAPASAAGSPAPYTCTGGEIQSKTYASVTVTGDCWVPVDGKGVIDIVGNLNVAPGGFFDAQSSPSRITVGKNVTAGAGSLLELGCQPNGDHFMHPCANDPAGVSHISVNGNVTATGSDTVLLAGVTVNGNVTLTGSSGGEDWVFKGDTIGGNFTASDLVVDFFGLLYNTIGRNASLTNISAIDPEDGGYGSVNIVLNDIGRNLNCSGLGPRLSGGFIEGAVNTTGGKSTGQCVGLVGHGF